MIQFLKATSHATCLSVITISLCLNGCNNPEQDAIDPEAKVDIVPTPPLTAGSSVSGTTTEIKTVPSLNNPNSMEEGSPISVEPLPNERLSVEAINEDTDTDTANSATMPDVSSIEESAATVSNTDTN